MRSNELVQRNVTESPRLSRKEVNQWRKAKLKEELRNVPFFILFIGSISGLLVGLWFRQDIFSMYGFSPLGKLLYFHLIATGIYILLIRNAVCEWNNLKLISGIILPIALFSEITLLALGIIVLPFFIYTAFIVVHVSFFDILRGRVKLKAISYTHEHPDVYHDDGSVRCYKRKLILERWNSTKHIIAFFMSFLLLVSGILIFEDLMIYLGRDAMQIFAVLNIIFLGFILMTAEMAFTEFKERKYISSIVALIFCELFFALYALGTMVIAVGESIFFLGPIFALLVFVSPLDMLIEKIKESYLKNR